MTACDQVPVWHLSRRARELLYWDVDGMPADATASVRLENGTTWSPLALNSARDRLSIWIAGPSFVSPDGALVVPVTSRAEIRVVAGQLTTFLDAGYVQLVP